MDNPTAGSRWCRNTALDETKGSYIGYTVLFITNEAHFSESHPAQVVYEGDNGHHWSLPLADWPGSLVKEVRHG